MKAHSLLKGRKGVVLDTMIFIYLFEDSKEYAGLCEAVLQEAGKGRFSGLITPVTAAEIMVKPLQNNRQDLADKYLLALKSMKNIGTADLTFETGALAGALRAKYGLPLPDMIQAAVALQAERPAMVTNDKALQRVSELDVLLLDEMR